MSDHLDERIPRGGPWPQPNPGAPHDEQPEAKEYPAPYQDGFCPFVSLYMPAPGGANVRKLMPCDPADCQLGLRDPARCSLRDIAQITDAHYIMHADTHAGMPQLCQVLQHLSDRLGANLQSIHGNNSRLIDLAKALDESPLTDTLRDIATHLGDISAALTRGFPVPGKHELP